MRLFLTESFPLCRNTSRIACWRNWRGIVSFDFDRYSVLLSPNQTVSVYFSLFLSSCKKRRMLAIIPLSVKAGSFLLVPSLLRKLHDSKNRGCRIRGGSVHAQLDWDEQTSQRKTVKRFTCIQSNRIFFQTQNRRFDSRPKQHRYFLWQLGFHRRAQNLWVHGSNRLGTGES